MCSVSVLLPFDHFQLRASQGIVLLPPLGTAISGSYIAPCANALLGRAPPADGVEFLVKAGSPEPVMTRHLWAAARAARPVAAGAAATSTSTATAARPTDARASERVGGVRIVFLSHPASRVTSRGFRPGGRKRFRNNTQAVTAKSSPFVAIRHACRSHPSETFRNMLQ